MPGTFSLYQDLTVEENLNFFAALFGASVRDSYELVEPIYKQIEPFKNRRAGKLSGGMKQKLALSCALIHRPKVLFLDEPTTGVDAVSRSEFWSMLADLKQRGITILVSTPYMDEASLCDRIALCNEGRLLGLDSPHQLVASFQSPLWAIRAKNMYALLEVACRFEGVTECYPFGEFHHLVVTDAFDAEKFARQMNHCDDFVMCEAHPTIEDLFIKLMKR
jgi:ABC-type multidrug transport system ATPase subunit